MDSQVDEWVADMIEVSRKHELIVKEQIALGLPHAGDVLTTHKLDGVEAALNANSTQPATKVSSGRVTLVAGVGAIDLTAAPGPVVNGLPTVVDFTGLKIQEVQFVAGKDNTGRVLIAPAGSNGYPIFGAAGCQVSIGPGELASLAFKDSLFDVDGTHKAIAITSTQAAAVLDFILVGG